MSIWMELMCDVRKDGTDPKDILRSRCFTNRNDNVMAHAHNTKVSVAANLRNLEAAALRQGWKKIKGDWVCPGCLAPGCKE